MKELTTKEHEAFLEEWSAFEVEAKFNLTQESMRWAHKGGELIRSWYKGELTEELVQNLTRDTGKSRATLFRWVALYDKDPDFDHLLESHGKNLTFKTVLGLNAPKEDKDAEPKCKHCPLHNCP